MLCNWENFEEERGNDRQRDAGLTAALQPCRRPSFLIGIAFRDLRGRMRAPAARAGAGFDPPARRATPRLPTKTESTAGIRQQPARF
jgi:hypothetical protein